MPIRLAAFKYLQAALRVIRLPRQGTRCIDQISANSFLQRFLKTARINVVFDVGANRGQYAECLRKLGYDNRIVSFEPQKEAYDALLSKAQFDPQWLAVNVALGSTKAVVELNITENSFSSSLLPLRSEITAIAPGLRYIAREKVVTRRLDDFYAEYVTETTVAFLKLDVQGYEPYVISGAREILKRCIGLQVEMALKPSYVGQALMPELVTLINEHDFRLVHLEPGFSDPHTGYTLEVEGFFVRDDL